MVITPPWFPSVRLTCFFTKFNPSTISLFSFRNTFVTTPTWPRSFPLFTITWSPRKIFHRSTKSPATFLACFVNTRAFHRFAPNALFLLFCARFHCAHPLSFGLGASVDAETWKDRAPTPRAAKESPDAKLPWIELCVDTEDDAPRAAVTREIALRSAITMWAVRYSDPTLRS
jgi:hypothetical protein